MYFVNNAHTCQIENGSGKFVAGIATVDKGFFKGCGTKFADFEHLNGSISVSDIGRGDTDSIAKSKDINAYMQLYPCFFSAISHNNKIPFSTLGLVVLLVFSKYCLIRLICSRVMSLGYTLLFLCFLKADFRWIE